MRLEYEVVHLVDGHLFDAESYELTSIRPVLPRCEPGYYLLRRTRDSQEWRDDAAPGLVGPFTSAEHAILAMRGSRFPISAIGPAPDGSPAAGTVSRDLETIS